MLPLVRFNPFALFFVDTDGLVFLPIIEASSNPEFNGLVLDALKRSAFERPHREGRPAVAWFRKTYKIPEFPKS